MSLAAAASGTYYDQVIEPKRRLSYIPQCEGSEERLRNCSTLSHDGNCAAPVAISCWNNSVITTSPTLAIFTSPENYPVSSMVSKSGILYTSEVKFPPTSSPTFGTADSPSTTSSTSTPPLALISLASGVGGVVALLLLAIAAVLLYLLCHRRRERVKPLDQPYEVPVTVVGSNQTFHEMREVPETEALYDKATTSIQEGDSREYHTLNHSPSASKPSPPLSSHSTGSSVTVPPVYDTVGPAASSPVNPARDPPTQKPPVYYHVLQNSEERVEEVKYHVLEEQGHRYHVLEEQQQEGGGGDGGRGPVYSEVVQRRAATLQPQGQQQAAPATSSNLTLSLPRNLSGSTSLL